MQISDHLSLVEVTKSNTATRYNIDNTPTEDIIANLKTVAYQIFEPLRTHFNVKIGISSGYRSKALNVKVGGSTTSHHCLGMALDIDADIYGGITNADIFNYIKDNLKFTQLIWEYGNTKEPAWVHVSYDINNLKNEILVCTTKGYIKYKK